MSSSKTTNDVIHYLSDYLNFDNPSVPGRPMVGLLCHKYRSGQINLEQTVSKLFRLKNEALFNEREESYIYSIENDYDCAKEGIYGSLEAVQEQLETFLSFYQDYSIHNHQEWTNLDKVVETRLQEHYWRQAKDSENFSVTKTNAPKWWKFW